MIARGTVIMMRFMKLRYAAVQRYHLAMFGGYIISSVPELTFVGYLKCRRINNVLSSIILCRPINVQRGVNMDSSEIARLEGHCLWRMYAGSITYRDHFVLKIVEPSLALVARPQSHQVLHQFKERLARLQSDRERMVA